MEELIFRFVTLMIGVITLALYSAISLQHLGLTPSISRTFKEWKGNKKYLYTAFMLVLGMSWAMAGSGGFFVLAAFLISVSGIAADVSKSERIARIHSIGAIGGMAVSLLGIWVHYNMPILAGIGGAIAIFMWLSQFKNHTYWIEQFIAGWFIIMTLINILWLITMS